jgi:multiple sugar transport system permease protein
MKKIKQFFTDFRKNWPHHKARLFGSGNRKGIIYYVLVYFLSITFAFVFIYPIFYMFMISLMSNTDLVDSTIMWIPSEIYWKNYEFAIRGLNMDSTFFDSVIATFEQAYAIFMESRGGEQLNLTPAQLQRHNVEMMQVIIVLLIPFAITWVGGLYTEEKGKLFGLSFFIVVLAMVLPESYIDSLYLSGTITFVTVISSALIGYGLARFNFKLKGFVFIMLLVMYILPKMLLFIPRALLYGDLGIKGTMFALWIPSFLGVGVQATFFILIFYQFFHMMPGQIEESAYLDGASSFKIFIKIAIPMALPAFVIAFVYGFAVNWNELFINNVYLNGNITTIPMYLQSLQEQWGNIAQYGANTDNVNIDFTESKSFAGTLLSVVPLIIMYGFIQRYFIESIDKSGIAGE